MHEQNTAGMRCMGVPVFSCIMTHQGWFKQGAVLNELSAQGMMD